jgi:hypothetical protein
MRKLEHLTDDQLTDSLNIEREAAHMAIDNGKDVWPFAVRIGELRYEVLTRKRERDNRTVVKESDRK